MSALGGGVHGTLDVGATAGTPSTCERFVAQASPAADTRRPIPGVKRRSLKLVELEFIPRYVPEGFCVDIRHKKPRMLGSGAYLLMQEPLCRWLLATGASEKSILLL